MSDKNLSVFVDGIGRTIVGELLNENKTMMEVKNPAIVHVQPNPQNGQISVQLIPFFFKEFQKADNDKCVWEFLKANLIRAKDIELDDRLLTQYHNMYSVIQTPGSPALATAAAADTPVIKLFDD